MQGLTFGRLFFLRRVGNFFFPCRKILVFGFDVVGQTFFRRIFFINIYIFGNPTGISFLNTVNFFLVGQRSEFVCRFVRAAKFEENSWNCGLDEAGIKESFQVIRADWDSMN